jgi:tryptophan synthase alpha chain
MQRTATTPIPASRITHAFEQARREERGVLIPYIMCGYPSAVESIKLALTAAQVGADIIELGMPFSDPLADGATIQHAGQVALENGMSIKGCLEIAVEISNRCDVPLIFMGYYNPILNYGLDNFCLRAVASGICGLIIPDLPPEEAEPLQHVAQQHGLSLIFLIPPTTPDERISKIAQIASSGHGSFIYCVALTGVTGARAQLPSDLHVFIQRVYDYTKYLRLPIVVGFGVSTPEHVSELTSYADGIVVGSALIKLIDQQAEGEHIDSVKRYLLSLRLACLNKKM